MQRTAKKPSKWQIRLNKLKTYFAKPQNVVLLLMGIVLTVTFAHQLTAALSHPDPGAFAWLTAIGIALVGLSVLLVRALRRWR